MLIGKFPEKQWPLRVDALSGIPLLLEPRFMMEHGTGEAEDDSHPWFYRRHPLLHGAGGGALRSSIVQIADEDFHHRVLHEIVSRPALPTTDEERHKPIVFAVGGYVPEQGVVFTRSKGQVLRPAGLPMPKSLRVAMRGEGLGSVRVDKPHVVAKFLGAELIRMGRNADPPEALLELVANRGEHLPRTRSVSRLAVAARELTAPFRSEYQEAYQAGLLPSGLPTPDAAVLEFVAQNYREPGDMTEQMFNKIPA